MKKETIQKKMAEKEQVTDKQTPKSIIKITTWNVAALAARWNDNFESYVKTAKPDILCVQETKFSEKTSFSKYKIPGYKAYFFNSTARLGYSGTAIYTKYKPISVKPSFRNNEGRCITMEFKNFYLLNTYCVNAGEELKTLDKKKKWNEDIAKCIKDLEAKKPVIWTGDLNVAHMPIDIWNSEGHDAIAGYTPYERNWFDEFLKAGHTDVFRRLYPDRCEYTFFNFRGDARRQNHGWRIDYFVVGTDNFEQLGIYGCVNEVAVDGSDHVPVTLYLDKEKAMPEEELIDKGGVELLSNEKDKTITSFFSPAKK